MSFWSSSPIFVLRHNLTGSSTGHQCRSDIFNSFGSTCSRENRTVEQTAQKSTRLRPVSRPKTHTHVDSQGIVDVDPLPYLDIIDSHVSWTTAPCPSAVPCPTHPSIFRGTITWLPLSGWVICRQQQSACAILLMFIQYQLLVTYSHVSIYLPICVS